MIDKFLTWLVAYLELGAQIVATHLLTVEGIIALMFGVFFLGLVSRIKS